VVLPTQHNSPIYTGHRPNIDAATVGTLRAAGALILGKTDTMESASTGRLAATRNPHNLERTPGGSSSGSAACVADLQVPSRSARRPAAQSSVPRQHKLSVERVFVDPGIAVPVRDIDTALGRQRRVHST
jgi:hypothetical protein